MASSLVVLFLAVLALSSLVPTGPVVAQARRNNPPPQRPAAREFSVTNHADTPLRELYLTPARPAAGRGPAESAPARVGDLLGEDFLEPDATRRLRLPGGANGGCSFEALGVFADDREERRSGLDLCRDARLGFGDPSVPRRTVTIENRSGRVLAELYAQPTGRVPGNTAATQPGDAVPGAPPPTLPLSEPRVPGVLPPVEPTIPVPPGRSTPPAVPAPGLPPATPAPARPGALPPAPMPNPALPRSGEGSGLPGGEGIGPRSGEGGTRGEGGAPRTNGGTNETAEADGAPDPWGIDRLDDTPLADGGMRRLTLRVPNCRVDLRAVYEDDAAEEKREVDVCRDARVTFDGSGIPRPPDVPFVLINRHAAPIAEFYVSAASESDWGADRLASPLDRGGQQRLTVAVDCMADLRAVFPNGAAEERREVDLCATGVVVLRPGWTVAARLDEGAPDNASPPPRPGSLRLRNRGSVPLVQIFLGPPEGKSTDPVSREAMSRDRLGRNVLGVNETLDLQPPEPGNCAASLRAVFRDGTEVRRDPVDLCSGAEMPLP